MKIFPKDKEARLVGANILGSVILKGSSLIVSLAMTRQYMLYFENDVILGGWYAIVSILNWMLYFDLGIGNGMRNEIVQPIDNKDFKAAQRYISTGYVVTLLISLLMVVLAAVTSLFLNWNAVLNLPKEEVSNTSLLIMVIISIVGIGFQFFLRTIISIYNAMRKTVMSGFAALMTNLIIFMYLLLAPKYDASEALIRFSVLHLIATCVPLITITLIAFYGPLKEARPSIKAFDSSCSKSITSLGMRFFVIQVSLLVISSSDSWLITHYYTPEEVVEYHIYYRFFSIALTVFAMFSQTSWSSVTKYFKEKKRNSINKTYRFLVIIAICGGITCLIVALGFEQIVKIWLSETDAVVSIVPAILFAGWMTMQMLVNAATGIANGMGMLKCQTVFVPVAGAIKLLSVVVLSTIGINWYSVLYSNIICLVPLLIAQHISTQRVLKTLSSDV